MYYIYIYYIIANEQYKDRCIRKSNLLNPQSTEVSSDLICYYLTGYTQIDRGDKKLRYNEIFFHIFLWIYKAM